MTSPVEDLGALYVGSVESVSPDRIVAKLDSMAPQTTALNAGTPTRFPRLNGYVLIPKEGGMLVGIVVWLGMEHAPARRPGAHSLETGVVDLPFARRRMDLSPVGTLVQHAAGHFELERGVTVYPSVGDQVVLPTSAQLRAIVEPVGANSRVNIGTAVLAAGAKVCVDPDKVFGRHVAVLGNTGSGKSCTVAGLIQWSLEAAAKARGGGTPNARFIVLDPNGEYADAFKTVPGGMRLFRVPPITHPAQALVAPVWLWNGHEWAAFAAASPRVQRPVLMQAIRELRSLATAPADHRSALLVRLRLRHWLEWLRVTSRAYLTKQDTFPARQDLGEKLSRMSEDLDKLLGAGDLASAKDAAEEMRAAVRAAITRRRDQTDRGTFYKSFGQTDFEPIIEACSRALEAAPELPHLGVESEDAPIPFSARDLLDRLDVLAHEDSTGANAGFLSTLVLRVRTMLRDRRMSAVISPVSEVELVGWLEDFIGANDATNGTVAVVDLSLVPSDVIHTVTSVLARVTFEATQRYRRLHSNELPTVLVLEEAHTFVRGTAGADFDTPTPQQMCRATFERIAREGRKFGLGLLLSSQRPSELSPTVLAQCNTFVLHRLVNDSDQELVRGLVPDNLSGLLGELPSLPTRHALVLGWATPLPVLTQIRALTKAEQPRSWDPAFWDTWTGAEARPIDWDSVARDWTRPDAIDGSEKNAD